MGGLLIKFLTFTDWNLTRSDVTIFIRIASYLLCSLSQYPAEIKRKPEFKRLFELFSLYSFICHISQCNSISVTCNAATDVSRDSCPCPRLSSHLNYPDSELRPREKNKKHYLDMKPDTQRRATPSNSAVARPFSNEKGAIKLKNWKKHLFKER